MELIDLSKEKVFIFSPYPQFYDFLITNDKRYCFSMTSTNIVLSDITLNKLQTEFNNKIKNIAPKDGAIFLFDKTSKFPRFKLCETSYKRCIKKGKEDFIIIGDIRIDSNSGFKKIVQTKDAYYLFPSFVYFRGISRELYQSDYSDIDFFIKKYENKLFSTEIINSYDYKVFQVSSPQFFIDIMTDKLTNVLTDSALDKIINGTLEKLDYDKFKQIKALIESSDVDNIGLGLRLLCNYDIEPMLASINLLIARNFDNIRRRSEWNSAAVKQLRKNLYIIGSPFYDINSITFYTSKPKKSDDDARCCEEMFKEIVLYYINPVIKNINSIAQSSDLKITLKPVFE